MCPQFIVTIKKRSEKINFYNIYSEFFIKLEMF